MKNTLLSIGVCVALILGVVGVVKHSTPTVVTQSNVGSATSPDISSPYISFGGLPLWAARLSLNTATSTPCSIQSPASTSTLETAGIQFTTGGGAAVTVRLATSTSAYATTTSVTTFTLPSGAQGSFVQIPATLAASLIAPNTFLVWGIEGTSTFNGSAFLGTCEAQFTQY